MMDDLLDALPPSLSDQIAFIERDLQLRSGAYPKLIARRRMRQERADRELKVLRAVLDSLNGLRPFVGEASDGGSMGG